MRIWHLVTTFVGYLIIILGFNSYVWVPSTTLLCSIFLPVLVKAILCIGKDLGMSTIAYASLMVELQQDGYTSKTRESQLF